MKIGLMYWPRDRNVPISQAAIAAEERGFSSLWVSEHTHIPVSRETPWPLDPETALPESYARMHDPFIALASAAAVTTKIRLGTGICILPQHDPIIVAKQLASIDQLSCGRTSFGIGYGWNLEELRNHGINPKFRRSLMAEQVAAIRSLWKDEVASYQGAHVTVEPSWQWPKPVQKNLPVLVGTGPWAFDEVAKWADGWLGRHHDDCLAHEIPELKRKIRAQGRDVSLKVIHSEPTIASLESYAEAEVDEIVIFLPPWPSPWDASVDEMLRSLDKLSPFVENFAGKA